MKKNAKNVSPLRIGNNVLIRTVTLYHTGKIELLTKEEIVLSSAAWIPDVGRFHETVKEGTVKLAEVEPFAGNVSINRGGVIDVTDWPGDLPIVVR